MPEYEVLYCPSHMQPANQQFLVRVLFCLTIFLRFSEGWVELLLLALLFITLSVVIF